MKFNIGALIRKAGGVAIKTVAPGVANLLDELKLPADTTGDQLGEAIQGLPAEQQTEILSRELDLKETEIRETNETHRAMIAADAASTHTTRPFIALIMAWVVAFATVAILVIWGAGVVLKDDALVTAVVNGWPMVLAILSIPGVLLKAYFGALSHEHGNKLAAMQGQPISPLGGALKLAGKLFNK